MTSVKGGRVCVICCGVENARVIDEEGKQVLAVKEDGGIAFQTEEGKTYQFVF